MQTPGKEAAKRKERDAAKKQRKELLALLMMWGLPDTQEQEQQDPAAAVAAAAQGSPAPPAADRHVWESWPGRAGFSPALQLATGTQLTAMLQVRVLTRWLAGQLHAPLCT